MDTMYRLLACITILLISPLSSPGQQMLDPAIVFSRSKHRLLADLERLPRYIIFRLLTGHRLAKRS